MIENLLKALFLFLLFVNSSFAQKISFGFGGYSIDAKVGDRSTNISSLGAYKLQYHAETLKYLELTIGYSVFIENIISGDKAFGPDIGFNYFPLGVKTASQSSISQFSFSSIKYINPFVSMKFSQRQYQSINTSYSGFAIGAGAEIGLFTSFSPYFDINYGALEGPESGTLGEISSTFGIVINY